VCHSCKKFKGKDDLETGELKAEHALKWKQTIAGQRQLWSLFSIYKSYRVYLSAQ
jgi:hypothetical protein